MRAVPLTVRVNSSDGEPQFSTFENQIKFAKDQFTFSSITSNSLSETTLQKLLSCSSTMILLGDSCQAADPTLQDVLNFGCSLDQAFVSFVNVSKNRSYVDAFSADHSRKFIRQMPLTRLAKRVRMDLEAAERILNPRVNSLGTHLDLPRQRTCSVITIYHNSHALTILDLAGTETLNTFCRLNDFSVAGNSNNLLAGFILDLVPMSNPRYYLHLNQSGDKASIGALLRIFGNIHKGASTTGTPDGTKSRSPIVSAAAPSYARPTKSSAAPKAKNASIYQVSKTLKKASKIQKLVLGASDKVMQNIKGLAAKGKQVENIKKQYNLNILKLRTETSELRACQNAILSSLSTAKEVIATVEQADNRKLESLQNDVIQLSQEKDNLLTLFEAERRLWKNESEKHINELSETLSAKSKAELDLRAAEDKASQIGKQMESLEHEKLSIAAKYQILLNSEKSLQDELTKLKTQVESSVSLQSDFQKLKEEKGYLASTVSEMKENENLHKERQRSLEAGISSLKKCYDSKCQEFDSLLKYKAKAQELELANILLRKELQDTKAQILRQLRLSDQVPLGSANDDVSKIFGYPDVDFGNITSTFSPITGFEQLSQIEFPSILKKPLSGIASSPNGVLRQSNIRFNAPPIGKLASSPIRKDLRSWEDIENQQ